MSGSAEQTVTEALASSRARVRELEREAVEREVDAAEETREHRDRGRLLDLTVLDSERRFEELANSMPQIVWSADPSGNIDYYNRRWYQFTGRPEGVSGDASWADVVHPDDQE